MDSSEDSQSSDQVIVSNDATRQKLIEGRSAENTRKGTKTWTTLLNNYIKLRGLGETIEDITDDVLPELLEKFFSEVNKPKKNKNKDDPPSPYKNSSMRVIRGVISRYLKEKRGIDTMSDTCFMRSRHLFQGVLKQNKAKGYGTITHKEAISSQDLERLYDYFSRYMGPDPFILQKFVQFNLM